MTKTTGHPCFVLLIEGHLEVVKYIVNEGAGIEIGDKDGVYGSFT